ncbi:unnamed protein product [Phytophthora lilii]|uniref:Unnamed protein product n=1 Tax=Phytophthora lilii TaxID=2077276 RepID=A0A9W6TYJ2_9STRA|nr:unnamed protein product [Phytophthora lilii]
MIPAISSAEIKTRTTVNEQLKHNFTNQQDAESEDEHVVHDEPVENPERVADEAGTAQGDRDRGARPGLPHSLDGLKRRRVQEEATSGGDPAHDVANSAHVLRVDSELGVAEVDGYVASCENFSDEVRHEQREDVVGDVAVDHPGQSSKGVRTGLEALIPAFRLNVVLGEDSTATPADVEASAAAPWLNFGWQRVCRRVQHEVQHQRGRVKRDEQDVGRDDVPIVREHAVVEPHDVVGQTGDHHVHVDEGGRPVLEDVVELLHRSPVETHSDDIAEDAHGGAHLSSGLACVSQTTDGSVKCGDEQDEERHPQDPCDLTALGRVAPVDGERDEEDVGRDDEPVAREDAVRDPRAVVGEFSDHHVHVIEHGGLVLHVKEFLHRRSIEADRHHVTDEAERRVDMVSTLTCVAEPTYNGVACQDRHDRKHNCQYARDVAPLGGVPPVDCQERQGGDVAEHEDPEYREPVLPYSIHMWPLASSDTSGMTDATPMSRFWWIR